MSHPQHLDPAALALLLDQLAQQLAQHLAAQLHAQQGGHAGVETASRWMSAETAAAYLDWPKQRLYKLTAAGKIPHVKVDGRLLFHRDELDHWLQGFAQGSS